MHTKLSLRKSAGLLSIAAVAILGFAGQSNADSKDAEQTKEDVINAPIDPTEITAKGHRWVRAADGRIIEYSVTGSTRPDARTLVTMYFATSKVRPDLMKTYEDLNIRLINVSLPGLGLSSFHPGRVVADWPKTDLDPILDAEGVKEFWVYGVSYGTIHAMAVAQHYGPSRVKAMGLRVPYFGLPLSKELGLPNGQMQFPTTDELRRDTPEVAKWRFTFNEMLGHAQDPSDIDSEYPEEFKAWQAATKEDSARTSAAMMRDHPEALSALGSARFTAEGMLYMMAKDVALDLPGHDPRKIELSGDRVVVWYAADDEDCPPSHGEWLAKHFKAKTRVFDGYGHAGGGTIDHPQFIEDLVGRP